MNKNWLSSRNGLVSVGVANYKISCLFTKQGLCRVVKYVCDQSHDRTFIVTKPSRLEAKAYLSPAVKSTNSFGYRGAQNQSFYTEFKTFRASAAKRLLVIK